LPPGMLLASRGRRRPHRSHGAPSTASRATANYIRSADQLRCSTRSACARDLLPRASAPAVEGPAVKPRTPGVYFGLSRASYHCRSVGRDVGPEAHLAATVEWWHSHMNHRCRTPQPCKSDGPCTSWCWRLCWRGLKEMDRASATTSALRAILILVLPRS